jgi:prolyl 4-hydroxylase
MGYCSALVLLLLVALCSPYGVVAQEQKNKQRRSRNNGSLQREVTDVAQDQTCSATDGDCSAADEDVTGDTEDTFCEDIEDQCEFWASTGECDANPDYMHIECAKACGTCAGFRQPMLPDARTFGVAQQVSETKADLIQALIDETEKYMSEEVWKDDKYERIRERCQNRHKECAFWAVLGECQANRPFMEMECAPSCKTCINLDITFRCPFDKDAPTVWGPGDLNKMFTRITTEPDFQKYNPKILSQPGKPVGKYDDGPWVITLENLLSDVECDRLIELGGVLGYEQSLDVGEEKFDGTFDDMKSEDRTSTNAWCGDGCSNDTHTQQVLQRLENITGFPDANSEQLQLLRYEVGQKYGQHHDYIEYQVDRPCGVRVLTVFLYLNDVEAGGGTDFPFLGVTVMPKKGSALLWPSVLDENPNEKDSRTEHQALPVEAGIKYGANAWLHQRSYKDHHDSNCV